MQIVEGAGQIICREIGRHRDILHRPLLAVAADYEEASAPSDLHNLHPPAQDIEEYGFRLKVAHEW